MTLGRSLRAQEPGCSVDSDGSSEGIDRKLTVQEKARKLPRGARPGALARGLAARCTRALAGFRGRPPGVGWGRWSTHVGEAVQILVSPRWTEFGPLSRTEASRCNAPRHARSAVLRPGVYWCIFICWFSGWHELKQGLLSDVDLCGKWTQPPPWYAMVWSNKGSER